MDSVTFAVHRDLNAQRVTYTLVLDAIALADVELDKMDRWLLRECEDGTVSDKLLALEMLVRRMEQKCVPAQRTVEKP